MPIAAIASIGSSLIGANASKAAAKKQAAATLQAGREAASAGAFRPVGISTQFGRSTFQMGTDKYGNPIVTGAGYEATPEIAALQQRLSGLYGQTLGLAESAIPTATGLFNLGGQYISESPEAARQRIFNQLQEARLPAQMQEEQRLAATAFGRGRAGINISGIGQPELYSLARAREAQRAADVAAAEQQAQQQITFGTGLMGTGLGMPTAALGGFQTALGTGLSLDEAARQSLALGAALGGRNVNTAGAQALLTSGIGAANVIGQQQQTAVSAGQLALQNFLKGLNFGGTQQPAPISDASVYAQPYGGTVESPWYG